MCILTFSTNFVRKISHSKKNWARYDHKYILVFMYSTSYSCQILMEFEFWRQIFVLHSNKKFYENPYWESRVVQCGQTDEQTDRHDKHNSRFSQFYESAQKVLGVFLKWDT
jgi:hypothetical protein